MRINLLVTTALSMSLLFACTTNANNSTKPEPSKSPVVSSTSNPSATPKPSSSSSVTPSSSPVASSSSTPIISKYTYSLPLKVSGKFECDSNATSKVFYELKDKSFSYNLNLETLGEKLNNDIQTKSLSDDELKNLNNLITSSDLAMLAEKDEKIPEDSPQTEECRTIEGITLLVNNKETTFYRNDRLLRHTKEYSEAYSKLVQKLQDMKEANLKSFDLAKDFEAKIGETFRLKDDSDNIVLKVDSKVEESRCPSDVMCIQAGKVSFKFVVYQYGLRHEFTLAIDGMTNSSKTELNGYKYTLVNVTPTSFKASSQPKDSDYKLTLKVEKI
jgi:hypothetical protein